MKSIIGIIPARKGSKRFPRKNLALLDSIPLVEKAIDVALGSEKFQQVFVTTDDPEVIKIAKQKPVRIVERNPQLADDMTLVDQAVINVMEILEKMGERYGAVCLMTPTAPMRTTQDVIGAVDLFFKLNADFVCTVTEFEPNPHYALKLENNFLTPAFVKDVFFKERKLLPALYRPIAVARIGKWEAVKKRNSIFGEKMIPYIISAESAIDIDNEMDLKWAQFCLDLKKKEHTI